MRPRRLNLLIVCAGDSSLHTRWFLEPRSFDILTIYYGEDEHKAQFFAAHSDFFFQRKGMKIALAREVLLEHLLFTERLAYADYAHIWFPDDDLEFARGAVAIEDMFANAGLSCADVFQPAIQNENYSPAWEATRLIPGAYAHRTNIVEIMAHGFSGTVFETCYLTAIHVYDFMKSGWGLEPIWTKIGEALLKRQLRTIVFDCVPIVHTRPLGAGITAVHQFGRYEAQFVPQIHTNRMQTLEVFESLQDMLRQQLKPITRDADKIESVHRTLFGKFSGR